MVWVLSFKYRQLYRRGPAKTEILLPMKYPNQQNAMLSLTMPQGNKEECSYGSTHS